MIWLDEYRTLRQTAENFIQHGNSQSNSVTIELLRFQLKKITKEECINNLIDILSDGRHFHNNLKFKKA